MVFISSEQREYHQVIDRTIETTETVLRTDAMRRQLGEIAVRNLLFQVDKLFVPKVRHGDIMPQRRLDGDAIPIIAIKPDDSIVIDPGLAIPTALQQYYMEKYFSKYTSDERQSAAYREGTVRMIEKYAYSPAAKTAISYNPTARATVSRHAVLANMAIPAMGEHQARWISSRPLVSIMYRDGMPRLSPATFLHELTHVNQIVQSPIVRYDTKEEEKTGGYRNELEAYSVSALAIGALATMGYEPEPGEVVDFVVQDGVVYGGTAVKIDNLRRETNKNRKDKFFPNGTLRNTLEQQGLDIT